jgi:hypothetical protein
MNKYERALIDHERKLIFKHYKKVYKLSWKVKKAIGCKWWRRYNKQQKAIIKDLEYMPEELADFLLKDDFQDLHQYLWSIESYLKFEQLTFNYNYSLIYEIGKMKELNALIHIHHLKIDSKNYQELN